MLSVSLYLVMSKRVGRSVSDKMQTRFHGLTWGARNFNGRNEKSHEICSAFISPSRDSNRGHFEHQTWVLNTTLSFDFFLPNTASITYRGNFNDNILEIFPIQGFTQRKLALSHWCFGTNYRSHIHRSRNVGNYRSKPRTSQKTDDLIYTAVEPEIMQ